MNIGLRARLSQRYLLKYFAAGVWMVSLGSYMNKALGFDSIFGKAYSMVGFATIIATLFVGVIADCFFDAAKVLSVISFDAGISLFWISSVTTSESILLFDGTFAPSHYARKSPMLKYIFGIAKTRFSDLINWRFVRNILRIDPSFNRGPFPPGAGREFAEHTGTHRSSLGQLDRTSRKWLVSAAGDSSTIFVNRNLRMGREYA